MQIEIHSIDASNSRGYYVWHDHKRLLNINSNVCRQFEFSDNDIFELLGEKKYKQFENGQCTFNVSKATLWAMTNDLDFYINTSF